MGTLMGKGYCGYCLALTPPYSMVFGVIVRSEVRQKYNLQGDCMSDCWFSAYCSCCSLIQMYREVKWRELEKGPPQQQDMNLAANNNVSPVYVQQTAEGYPQQQIYQQPHQQIYQQPQYVTSAVVYTQQQQQPTTITSAMAPAANAPDEPPPPYEP